MAKKYIVQIANDGEIILLNDSLVQVGCQMKFEHGYVKIERMNDRVGLVFYTNQDKVRSRKSLINGDEYVVGLKHASRIKQR